MRTMLLPKIGKQFIKREAGVMYMNAVARHQGYVLSIKSNKTNPNKKLGIIRTYFECSKADSHVKVKTDPSKEPVDSKEKDNQKDKVWSTSSKKTGCTFEVSLNYHSTKGRWVVTCKGLMCPHSKESSR